MVCITDRHRLTLLLVGINRSVLTGAGGGPWRLACCLRKPAGRFHAGAVDHPSRPLMPRRCGDHRAPRWLVRNMNLFQTPAARPSDGQLTTCPTPRIPRIENLTKRLVAGEFTH